MSNTVKVQILGDASSASKAFKQVSDDAEKTESKLSSIGGKLKDVGGSLSTYVTLPLVGIGAVFANEFMDAQKVTAQTEAVLKSTGGAANVTADHIDELSNSLLQLSGVDDEAIKQGENMLLTFTNIQNRVGAGNDIFDQATKTALDMSVALGEDMTASSMRLGKALNDPIQGVGALRKVGVQLSDQQEKQVKDFMAVGDVASAQKVILGELAKEFGGSAEAAGGTFAGQMEKLKNNMLNLGASIVEKLMPHLEKLMGWVQTAVEWFSNLDPNIQQIIVVVGILAAALGPLLGILGTVATVLGAVLSPIGLVIAAIAALAAGIWWLYNNNEDFRNGIQAVWDWIQNNVIPIAQQVFGYVTEQIGHLVAWAQEMWPKFQEAAEHVWNAIQAVIQTILNVITSITSGWGDNLMNIVGSVWDWIKSTVETVINIVRNIIEAVVNAINGDWGAAWENVKAIFGAAWEWIKNTLSNAWDVIKNIFGMAIDFVKNIFGPLWNWLSGVIGGAMSWVWDHIQSVWKGIMDFFGSIPGRIAGTARGMFDGIINSFKGAVNAIIGAWNNLDFGIHIRVPDWVPVVGGRGFDVNDIFPDIPYLAKGGNVFSSGMAVVGDAGPELLNLPKGASVHPLRGGMPGGLIVQVFVEGNVTSEYDLAMSVRDTLIDIQKRNGSTGLI